ncbi:MAG TPA: CoA-binding protein [Kiritimatiellia bacterium]|nr:CoA-binding protein [Kiritimatiellia bacterium]HMO99432.1 CoA-binding protein [Kiritimatiellia bacterium]HMP97741.1 CoA-binding protein [Kiritimatiellia bacterium]
MKVAVLGASPKPERYANQAVRLLREFGHDVIPVTPAHTEVAGVPAAPNLEALPEGGVDTVTVYVSPAHSATMTSALLRLRPRRVIFNPGAENPALAEALRHAGIEVEDACTLVLLRLGAF